MIISVLQNVINKDHITKTEAGLLAAAYNCNVVDVEHIGAGLTQVRASEHLVVNSHGAGGTLARSGGARFSAAGFFDHLCANHLTVCDEVHLYACQTGLDGDPKASFGGVLATLLGQHFKHPVAVWAPRGNCVYDSGDKRFRIKRPGSEEYFPRASGWTSYVWIMKSTLAWENGEPKAPNEAAFNNDPYNQGGAAVDDGKDWGITIESEG